jgi:hypothetical protein
MPELAISAEKVGFLIEKTREFDVKGSVSDPDSGSNAGVIRQRAQSTMTVPSLPPFSTAR